MRQAQPLSVLGSRPPVPAEPPSPTDPPAPPAPELELEPEVGGVHVPL